MNTAAAIARSTTMPICRVPVPMSSTKRSATMSPTATPKTSSTARLVRWPSVTLKEITAAIGAKNGDSCPSKTIARR
jgi:hypothetical protein